MEEDKGGGGGDPVRFPSRFTRRLQLEDDDDEEEDQDGGVDGGDVGEHKSRLISQASESMI